MTEATTHCKRRTLKLITCANYTKLCNRNLHTILVIGAVCYKLERAQTPSLPQSLSISIPHTGNIPNVGMKVITSILFHLMWCRAEFLSRSTKITGVVVSHVHSKQQQCKMADIVDVCTRQRMETEFHTVGGSSLKEIRT